MSGKNEFLLLLASFDGKRACERDVGLDGNPYRGRSGQEWLADAWEDAWLDAMERGA